MTVTCAPPDAAIGVALRLAVYTDCQARAIGENGFNALIGSAMISGVLAGLVTIFVAIIGYRLILGHAPSFSDGIGWAVRLGIVLTLVTTWPAFQTLFYNVAADGPSELAGLILPSAGLPDKGLDARVQLAYDTMRLGVAEPQPDAPDQARSIADTGQPATVPADQSRPRPVAAGQLPQTASVFAISTVGVSAALRIAIGFLLAVAPFAMLALLFDATLGIFSGWVRALAGAALALLASTIVTAIDLVMVEGEIASQQQYGGGLISTVSDPQALTTLVLLFSIVMLFVAILAARMTSAFKLRSASVPHRLLAYGPPLTQMDHVETKSGSPTVVGASNGERSRAVAVAESIALAAARDRAASQDSFTQTLPQGPARTSLVVESLVQQRARGEEGRAAVQRGRALGRRTRRATARDSIA